MRKGILALFIVFLMTNFGFAEDKPPAGYQGPIAEMPKLSKGDRWDYERRGKVVSYELTEENIGQLVFQLQWDDGSKETEGYTPDLNFFKKIDYKGEIAETVTPYRGSFSFPLWVGKKWSYSWQTSKTKQAASLSQMWDSHVKVAAYEQVKVPAGTFWAFKIEEVRSNRGAKHPKAYHVTTWYSPNVKLPVKVEEDEDAYNRNLIKYMPAK